MNKKLKRKLTVIISMILVLSMLGGSCVFADTTKSFEVKRITEIEMCQALIAEIESKLEEKGTTIVSELRGYIAKLERDSGKLVRSECESSVDDLVIIANRVLNTFCQNANEEIPTRYDELEEYYLSAAGAIIAWFSLSGYYLSAELLTHALDNTVTNSIYYPVYGDRVEYSDVFWYYREQALSSHGDGEFPNTGSAEEKDLYYAIHCFTWDQLANGKLRITDRYDFEYDKQHWYTIPGIATNLMYGAQMYGVLTPYWVYIID